MGRRPKEGKFVEKHISIPEDVNEQIEKRVEKEKLTYTVCAVDLMRQGIKGKPLKYKGFEERIMNQDFTCDRCGKRYGAGKLALYDEEFGGTTCIECAIRYKMTTKNRVKLLMALLDLKEDVRALKIERKNNADKYRTEYTKQTVNLTEAKQHNKDEELTPKIIELIQVNIKLTQTTDPVKEKELLEKLSQLYRELTSFVYDRKAVREKILQERQKLLEERQKQERKERRKKKQSYAT